MIYFLMRYLLFAGYYGDENRDDSYAADQQFLKSWANPINVVSIIIIRENILKICLCECYVYIHNIEISERQNGQISKSLSSCKLFTHLYPISWTHVTNMIEICRRRNHFRTSVRRTYGPIAFS